VTEIIYALAVAEFFAILYLWDAKIDLHNLGSAYRETKARLDNANELIERLRNAQNATKLTVEPRARRSRSRNAKKEPDVC
jgi:hypothetical protein